MNKRISAFVLAAACGVLCIAGCSDNNGNNEQTVDPYEAKFEDDLLCGYQIKFYDSKLNEIEELNKPLASGEAVAAYSVIDYRDELGYYSIYDYEGNKFFERVESQFTDRGNKDIFNVSMLLEENFYLTHDYSASYYCVEWLYFNQESKVVSTLNHSHSFTNNAYGISTSQSLSADGINGKGQKYANKYSAEVKVNVKFIDTLTNVNVIEFDKNNSIIKTTNITNDGENKEFTPAENCDYVLIEEEYKNSDGETYNLRTLINKGNKDSVTLKFPYKFGLVKPTKLNMKW